MLGWSRDHLAVQARVGVRTIIDFERSARSPIRATRDAIRDALEAGGVEFTDGDQPGVRMAARSLEEGNDGRRDG